MESLINNMIEILKAQYDNYINLLELSRKKSNVIVDGRMDELEKIVKLEERLIVEAGRLEQMRMNTAHEFASGLGIPQDQVTMDVLMEHGSEVHRKRLAELKGQLNQYVVEQKRINDLNERLIKNYLDYIEFSLNLLVGGDEQGLLYDSKNKGPSAMAKRNLYDKKI